MCVIKHNYVSLRFLLNTKGTYTENISMCINVISKASPKQVFILIMILRKRYIFYFITLLNRSLVFSFNSTIQDNVNAILETAEKVSYPIGQLPVSELQDKK